MTPMRKAAWERLPDARGVFLRCDRGEALYVTNAPARAAAQIDWAAAGFDARDKGKLTFLWPKKRWIPLFADWAAERTRCKGLTDALRNACFGETDEEDMRLWIEGVKRLERRGDAREYEKMVRQRAAVCLRKRQGGGTLAACALIVEMMNEGGMKDED